MRHRLYGKKLGRNKNERVLLFKSLVHSLFLHGTITTTETKAKAIKGLVDKVINLAKNKHTQRFLQSYLINKNLQKRLIKEIVPKLDDRVSGYTSLLRLGERPGDKSVLVRMSLIGNENLKPLEQLTSKQTEEIKKPVVKKATPVKKVTAKKTTNRKRTSK